MIQNEKLLKFNIHFKYINSKIEELDKIFLNKRKIDLTQREFSYVALVGNNPTLQYSELVELDSITKSTFSNQIKSLEKKGLVIQKNTDDRDKRKKFLALTESGLKVLDVWIEVRKYFFDNYLTSLSNDEKEELLRIGEKMVSELQNINIDNLDIKN